MDIHFTEKLGSGDLLVLPHEKVRIHEDELQDWGATFVKAFGMMDSDQQGEREAAFNQVSRMLRQSHGSFASILENSLSEKDRQKLEEALRANAELGRQMDMIIRENEKLRRRAKSVSLRLNFKEVAGNLLSPQKWVSLVLDHPILSTVVTTGTIYGTTANVNLGLICLAATGVLSILHTLRHNSVNHILCGAILLSTGISGIMIAKDTQTIGIIRGPYNAMQNAKQTGVQTSVQPLKYDWKHALVVTVQGEKTQLDVTIHDKPRHFSCITYTQRAEIVPWARAHDPALRVLEPSRSMEVGNVGDCDMINKLSTLTP